jgi:hypothetical protein
LFYDYELRRDGGNKAAIFGNIAIMAAASRINKNVNICRDKVVIKNKEEKFTGNVHESTTSTTTV